ncbi:MAG TPA: hypothetical protein QGH10_26930 [Armatimonadota bacterium]|nr:hypothetical protein [Armatimonadota bacterium]
MKEQQLDTGWKLRQFDDGEGESLGAHLGDHDDSGWIPATVPGQVHMDLMAAGEIEDPFFGLNYEKCLWVEEKEWWYRTEITPRRDEWTELRMELAFEGLDTFATVYLNGEVLGESRNMWVPVHFDVTDKLKWDEPNTIAVRFRPPLAAVRPDMEADDTEDVNAFFSPRERLYARKAQMSYGWDISPRIVSVGIWRPAVLRSTRLLRIVDFWSRTDSLEDGCATVTFEVTVENYSDRAIDATCNLQASCDGRGFGWSQTISSPPGRRTFTGTVTLDDPQLWWPHGMGEQNLYRGEACVTADGERFECYDLALGVRTIELVTEDPKSGESRFYFAVNGVPCAIRGTNWMPTDAMFARVDRGRLQRALTLCTDAHCNMLRIWGGGIYEDPEFYRLCDEMGLMVWQDFMYACGLYPQNEDFLQQAREEAEWVVRELRGHPCVAIWAGDNENDAAWGWHGKPDGYLGNRITREVLPEVCERLDPSRSYVPSSPYNPSGSGDPQSPDEGDVHIWDHSVRPRHPMYFEDRSRFISEIGRICAANRSSTERFLAPEDQWPHANKAWEHHVGSIPTEDFERRQKTDLGVRNLIGRDAESLDEYIAASQYMQAWCLGEWIERARRRKFECGGILWWNIFDNWPQHVDAVVDYYFGEKVGYRAVQRASRLLLPSIALNDGVAEVSLVNDHLTGSTGRLTLSVVDLQGNARQVAEASVSIAANASSVVLSTDDVGEIDSDANYLRVLYAPEQGDPIENWHILDDCASLAVFEAVYGPVND